VEIFDDWMEIPNPGEPLVDTLCLVDPRRDSAMRRWPPWCAASVFAKSEVVG